MQKRRYLVSGILLAAALGTSLAGARQITPINGNAQWGSEANCFNFPDGMHPSRLVQQCDGTHNYLFDIPVDTATSGNRSGNLWGKGGGLLGSVSCYIDAYTMDGETGTWAYGSRNETSWGKLSFNGSTTWTVSVPTNGTLHAFCEMPKGTTISGLQY